MKKILLSRLVMAIAMLWLPTQLWAQDYQIKFASGPVTVETPDVKASLTFVTSMVEVVNGKQYCYLQFNETPNAATRAQLQEAGVNLLHYLPDFTYEAALNQGFDANALLNAGLRVAIIPDAQFKMSAALARDEQPGWAVSGGNVHLNVQYAKDITEAEALSLLPAWAKLQSTYSYSQLLTLELEADLVETLALSPWVRYLEYIDAPAEPENLVGRSNHRSNVLASEYSAGRKYDGSGVVVAMGDDGIIGPHIDYEGRTDQTNVSNNNGDHGDHVAGIIMGAGNIDPTTRGMASGADLYVYSVWDAVNNTPTTYFNPGVRLTSTSYGNGCNAGYTAFAQTADQQVHSMSSLMHVFSCGNSGSSDCGYGAGGGWGNITGGIKIGKNVIAVGNLSYVDGLANSSSRGPAHDGRVKPDVCAVGSSVYSTTDPNSYRTASGTSMACPGVTGTLAQLYQAYKDVYGVDPNSGLMKATLMNTAEDLGNDGPDYEFGYGRINAARSVELIEDGRFMLDSLGQSGANSHSIVVPAGVQELRVMLFWVDVEASANASVALVNDLDLTLTDPSNTDWDPWVLDPTPVSSNLSAPATRGADHLNNVEQVTLDAPAAGTYTVNVSGFNVPQGPQRYYVLYEFLTDQIDLTYPLGGEGLNPGETETIRWDTHDESGVFTIEYSIDNGGSWNLIDNAVSGADRFYDWVVPAALSGECWVRVSRGSEMGMSAAPFSIIEVPTNLDIPWACTDSLLLTWDPVPGATAYEVSMLGVKYMDSIGTTTNTAHIVTGVAPANSAWFSVKALGPQNAIGRRAIAIEKAAGTFSCPVPIDAAVNSIDAPLVGVYNDCHDLDSLHVTLTIQNLGLNDINNVPVNFQLDNGPVQTETAAGLMTVGQTSVYTFTAVLDLSAPGVHTLYAWTSIAGEGNTSNDSTSINLEVVSGAVQTLPWSEDFDGFASCAVTTDCEAVDCQLANGFVNLENLVYDDIDWRVDQGGTASANTGPTVDHTLGTNAGKYLYTEASGGCEFRETQMLTPCLDLAGTWQPELHFWQHMEGGDIGELHVDVFSNGQWTLDVMTPLVGAQGTDWIEETVDLSAFVGEVINVRFRGITGGGWQGDIAIDDINVYDAALPAASFQTNDPACENTIMTFSSNSTGSGLTYAWDFGAGSTPATANTAGPHDVVYNSTGSKTVTLTVTNGFGNDVETQNFTVEGPPTASFTSVPNGSGLSVEFNDGSMGSVSIWSWDYGDGNVGSGSNPTHVYSGSGIYNVTLIITGDCGSDTTTETITVIGTGIEESALQATRLFPNPNQGQFTLEGKADGNLLNLRVMDAQGREVYSEQFNPGSSFWRRPVDLSNLADGMYIVRLESDNEYWQSRVTLLR